MPLPSLRSRLSLHVLLPLAMVWLVGGVITNGIAYYFVVQAFDRSLLDDAYNLATNVRQGPNGLELRLSQTELNSLLYDQNEETYMAVFRPDGSLISGHPWLKDSRENNAITFSDIQHQGKRLRAVSLLRQEPAPFSVVMAQTTQSRSQLLQRLLAFSLIPQALLLLGLAWWIRRAITGDIKPLNTLVTELNQRDTHDLATLTTLSSFREVKNLSDAANALMLRIQSGIIAQREFTGNVAHELRTPLAGIRAQAEYALRQQDPEVWRHNLQGIVASQERASHHIDQLLAMAFADENSSGIVLAPVRLDQIVQRLILQALPRANALHVDLGAMGIEDSVNVMGEPALLEGVIGNLLDNALRYGKPVDGQTAQITICVAHTAQNVCLALSDNGPGMLKYDYPQQLKRWQSGSLPQKSHGSQYYKSGSGLGLSIVSRYVQLLGAQIEFDSTLSGTVVKVLLQPAGN